MTVTRSEAFHGNEFHAGNCTRHIGPKGGVTTHTEVWRRNGDTKLWVTRPEDFRVPIKYGMRTYNYLTQDNAHLFHTPEKCPLRDPNYATTDARPHNHNTQHTGGN